MAAATASQVEKAGFWIRVAALLIDGVVLSVIGNILLGGDTVRSGGVTTLLGLAYYAYFWTASGKGATLGMRLMKIRVVKTDGSPLTVGDALVRYLMLIVSFVALFIGVIWVAFDANKQGWHDKVAGTYVVKAA